MYIDEKCANNSAPQAVKHEVSEEWLACCKFTM